MKEDYSVMRRRVRCLVVLLTLTSIALLTASIALIKTKQELRESNSVASLFGKDLSDKALRRSMLHDLSKYNNLSWQRLPQAIQQQQEYHPSTTTKHSKDNQENNSINSKQHYSLVYTDDYTVFNIGVNRTTDNKALRGMSVHRNDTVPLTRVERVKYDITLDDILITVKTTQKYHATRLKLILQTWFPLAVNQTLFFSDAEAPEWGADHPVSSRLVVTDCPATHHRRALCCKMARELDAFLQAQHAKWWCHFDDDNYVHVRGLLGALGGYDPRAPWYLGRPSIRAPLQILNRDDVTQRIAFWFATGGAGFCVSRALALQMMPLAGGGKLISVGDRIRLPDDVTIGYIIEHLLRQRLTVLQEFHSHLESMRFLDPRTLDNQISLSYAQGGGARENLLHIAGLHPKLDPTRMLSLHCLLYPDTSYCPR